MTVNTNTHYLLFEELEGLRLKISNHDKLLINGNFDEEVNPGATFTNLNKLNTFNTSTLNIPDYVQNRWQNILNITCEILDVPTALIRKVEDHNMEIICANSSGGNPYEAGQSENLIGSYCAQVVEKKEMLLVESADRECNWVNNPDINNGMISYLGYSLILPNGKVFGTFCVLDKKERVFKTVHQNLLQQFRDIIASQLSVLYKNAGDVNEDGYSGIIKNVIKKQNQKLENLLVKRTNELSVTNAQLFREIIEREKAEELIKLHSTALEAAANSIVITNIRGDIVWVNSAFTKLTGYTGDEILYKNVRSLNSGKHDSSFYKKLWDTILSGEVWHGEIINRHKDGSLYHEEQTITPVMNDQHEIKFFVSIKQDITERKNAEEALHQSYMKLEELAYIVNQSPAVGFLWTASKGLPVKFVSDNIRLFGYNPEQFYSGEIQYKDIVYHKDRKKILEEKYAKQDSTTESFKHQYRIVTKSGDIRWVEDNTLVRFNERGEATHYQGVVIDITERIDSDDKARLQQEQLIQADKMVALGTLVSGVAHEINNPNNFVMLNVPILEKTWHNISPILEDYYKENGDFLVGPRLKFSKVKESIPILLQGISEGTKRIKNIVHELKDFARKESSDSNQNVNINEVIEAAITLTSNLLNKSTDRFALDLGAFLPNIEGNFQRLEQVIINLLENSCQALQNKSNKILICTKFDEKEDCIIVKIEDEGCGMDEETLKKITDPFFTTKRHSGGTGLGLSVSSNIIINHGGTINFDSSSGLGTTATIILPCKKIKYDNETNIE